MIAKLAIGCDAVVSFTHTTAVNKRTFDTKRKYKSRERLTTTNEEKKNTMKKIMVVNKSESVACIRTKLMNTNSSRLHCVVGNIDVLDNISIPLRLKDPTARRTNIELSTNNSNER